MFSNYIWIKFEFGPLHNDTILLQQIQWNIQWNMFITYWFSSSMVD
jgi:hypothetical protein